MPSDIDWKDVDWADLCPRLTLYASRRMNRVPWAIREQPAYFVQEAIHKALTGVRKWDPAACTRFRFLCGVISSDIDSAARRFENSRREGIDDRVIPFPQLLVDPRENENIIDIYRRFISYIEREYQEDENLIEVARLRFLEQAPPREIIEELDLDDKKYAAFQRKLTAAILKFGDFCKLGGAKGGTAL